MYSGKLSAEISAPPGHQSLASCLMFSDNETVQDCPGLHVYFYGIKKKGVVGARPLK